jgi:hypothetical protein
MKGANGKKKIEWEEGRRGEERGKERGGMGEEDGPIIAVAR